jgi:hypothetical protein
MLDYLEAVHVLVRRPRSSGLTLFEVGKCIKATIRQLGYPTKNSLTAWHREYEQCRVLRTGYVRATPRYRPNRTRLPSIIIMSHDRCAAATLRALGYPSRGTLAACIEELCPEIEKRLVGRVAGRVPKSLAVKRAAVIESCAREESAGVVAQRTGVSRPMLCKWREAVKYGRANN